MHRNNVPSTCASDYYKKAVTIPLIDNLSSQLDFRFSDSNQHIFYGLDIIPERMLVLVKKFHEGSITYTWRQNFKKFSDYYEDDLPNPIALESEFELFERYWITSKQSPPATVSSTLKSIAFAGFENIKVLLRILATLPITSCECERSFSAMRRLKSYCRSTMVSDRFNGLAMMYIHRERFPDVNDVIDMYGGIGNRRLAFVFNKGISEIV
jgi:hypothetical protein